MWDAIINACSPQHELPFGNAACVRTRRGRRTHGHAKLLQRQVPRGGGGGLVAKGFVGASLAWLQVRLGNPMMHPDELLDILHNKLNHTQVRARAPPHPCARIHACPCTHVCMQAFVPSAALMWLHAVAGTRVRD